MTTSTKLCFQPMNHLKSKPNLASGRRRKHLELVTLLGTPHVHLRIYPIVNIGSHQTATNIDVIICALLELAVTSVFVWYLLTKLVFCCAL
mmetsp:Transcript_23112/g.48754  ORF Transcript_23112/g.48754 Transcript_23112/m.48754 type:complete len:91 (-) Transcript_23112:105-377(-)